MKTHQDRITQAMERLADGLMPFVEGTLKNVYAESWLSVAQESFRKNRTPGQSDGDAARWDAHTLLTVMWDQWNAVFRTHLGRVERGLVNELREFRNRWAHQEEFDFRDTYRILDSVERLLEAVSAAETKQVAESKRELLRAAFNEEVVAAHRRARVRAKRWQQVILHMGCCAAIVIALLTTFGLEAVFIAAAVTILFSYFCYRAMITEPILIGAHECPDCGRVIYSEPCPYCEGAVFKRTG